MVIAFKNCEIVLNKHFGELKQYKIFVKFDEFYFSNNDIKH